MITLAIETSTSHGGVAVVRDETTLSRETWTREKSHSELVTQKIESALQSAGIRANDLTALAVGTGPGSFTGIRVAVNAARSLAYALHLPIFPFDTTEILAASIKPNPIPLLTLINAHKNLVFASTFRRSSKNVWQRDMPLELLSLDALEKAINVPHLCVGDGFREYEAVISPGLKSFLLRTPDNADNPKPDVLGLLAFSRRNELSPLDWNQLQALYIRESGAEEKYREGKGN